MTPTILDHNNVRILTSQLSDKVNKIITTFEPRVLKVYGVPRGGIPVAYMLGNCGPVRVVESPGSADVIVDDIIASGATRERYAAAYPTTPFLALIDKQDKTNFFHDKWVVFPWEETAEVGIQDHIARIIEYVGDDVSRGGLVETPTRVAKALSAWYSGYGKNPANILKVFEDGGEAYDQMVTVKEIPFYSHCEHHMAPFFGTATISYIPDGKIVGLSKLSRLVDMFARRLQVQERMTAQIADALQENLQPVGVGVLIKARHLCMESRGVQQQGHHTITTALRGMLLDDASAKAEFMALAK